MSQSQKNEKATEGGFLENILNSTAVKSVVRTAIPVIVRSILSNLGLGGKSRKSTKSNGWFGFKESNEGEMRKSSEFRRKNIEES